MVRQDASEFCVMLNAQAIASMYLSFEVGFVASYRKGNGAVCRTKYGARGRFLIYQESLIGSAV